jgi:hypothetical protein
MIVDLINVSSYKNNDSFFNKTINMQSATDYDCFIRNSGVRFKTTIVSKNKSKSSDIYYVLEDIISLAIFDTIKVDKRKKEIVSALWEWMRISDDFFHSFYDENNKDYVKAPIRGSTSTMGCVSFQMIPNIVLLVVKAFQIACNRVDKEELLPVYDYGMDCKFKCCDISANIDKIRDEYKVRRFNKIGEIRKEMDKLSSPKKEIIQEKIKEEPKETDGCLQNIAKKIKGLFF